MSDPISILNRAEAATGQTIRIADRGPVGQVTLRGDLGAAATKTALKQVLGVDLPDPLSATFEDDKAAIWMSPDELLLLTAYDQADDLAAALSAAMAEAHHMALNVSDARAVLSLEGNGVAEVLAKGAPVDMANFPIGHARRTHISGIAVGFWRTGETEWEIVCFRSFARHLFDWLVVSSREGSEVGAI